MTTPKTREYVNGTSGKPEYLVIARSGRCVIAIKPELQTSSKQRAVGLAVRVRVCGDPKVDFSEDAPLTATEIVKVLPHVPLQNADATRGSIAIQGAFKIPLDETIKQGAINRANHKDTVLGFAHTIVKTIKLPLDYTEQEIADFVQQKWERIALKIGATEDEPEAVKKAADSTMALLAKLVADHNKHHDPKPEDGEPA